MIVNEPHNAPHAVDEGSISAHYFACERPEMFEFLGDFSGPLLELGCGQGAFATAVKAKTGCIAWAIEQNQAAAQIAAQHLDNVLVGTVEDILESLPAHYFDRVVCNDVLEHLAYPDKVLQRLKLVLTPDGKIIASIPNIRFIEALRRIVFDRDFRYDETGIFDRTHLRFFTEKSINRLFDESGYTVEKLQGLDPPAYIKRWRSWRLVNLLSRFKFFDDMRFVQFACVASLKKSQPN